MAWAWYGRGLGGGEAILHMLDWCLHMVVMVQCETVVCGGMAGAQEQGLAHPKATSFKHGNKQVGNVVSQSMHTACKLRAFHRTGGGAVRWACVCTQVQYYGMDVHLLYPATSPILDHLPTHSPAPPRLLQHVPSSHSTYHPRPYIPPSLATLSAPPSPPTIRPSIDRCHPCLIQWYFGQILAAQMPPRPNTPFTPVWARTLAVLFRPDPFCQ